MKPLIILTSFLLIMIVTSTAIQSQELPPQMLGEPRQAPIDGGLGLLAAAGGAYALKKLRDKSSSKKNQDLEL